MKKGWDKLTQELIGLITTSLAQRNPFFNELIVSFTNRKVDVLEAILDEVYGASGRKKYPTLSAQTSALFYFINSRRPFPSGNRRIALAVFFYLLAQEGKWLRVSESELERFAQWVALSPVDSGEEVIAYVEKFIRKHEVKMERSKGSGKGK